MKKGWPVTRLGNLADLVTKGTTPTSIGHSFVEDGINFVKIESISTTGEFINNKFGHITLDCHAVLRRSQLKAGDILFSIAGALGRTAFVTDAILPANTNQALAIIRLKPDDAVFPKFVLKALETGVVLEQIEKFKGGVAQLNLSLVQVRDLQIALPPLSEQQRIVAILDEAFADLATAKANAEKNLKNARALFESHLNSVFEQRSEGWVETTLEKILSSQPRNGWSPPAANHSDTGTPVLTLSSVTGFQFRAEKIKYTSAPTDIRRHYWVNNGDFLITRSNTPELVGHVAIASGIEQPTIYPDLIMRMNPNPEKMMTEFLYYQLRTPKLRSEITSRAQGANPTMKKLNKEAVQTLPICMPPISVQKRAVNTLSSLASETQRLESLYQRKLAALDELKQSLLNKAFTGEL
jgi:type I restriction enzyme S subunit